MATSSLPQSQIVSQFLTKESFEGTVGDLLIALEGPQKSPLTVANQAEIYALLWELGGHLRMLREHISEGRTTGGIRSIRLAQRAVSDLFGAIPLTDRGMVAANKKVAAMPVDSARKEALDFAQAQHDAYARRHGLTK
jgi:hypothetical protein